MAIRTVVRDVAVEAAGTARLEYDYDDVDLRVRFVRVVNSHPTLTARATAKRNNGTGQVRTLDGLPAQTTEVAVPTTAAVRLQLIVRPNGRLDGVETSLGWL